jgi:hypothetical protein
MAPVVAPDGSTTARRVVFSSPQMVTGYARVALHFIHYNFAWIHKTLCIIPVVACLSDHVWNYEEIVL